VQIGCLEGEVALAFGQVELVDKFSGAALEGARAKLAYRLELRALLGLAGVNVARALDTKGEDKVTLFRKERDLAPQALGYAERVGLVPRSWRRHNSAHAVAMNTAV